MNSHHTLDPNDWEDLEDLGQQVFSEMIAYLKQVRERKVWQEVPDRVMEYLKAPIPKHPRSIDEIYLEIKENILPYPPGNIHPRFWGWVNGSGTPQGIIAEMIIATMNVNAGGREHVANYVEMQVVSWMLKVFGFPEDGTGVLTSGCSEANLLGLTVARNTMLDFDIREQGIQGMSEKIVFYGSNQMHSSLQKACEILGIGNAYLRRVPTNNDYSIDIKALGEYIRNDKIVGLRPICIIANAGTVNRGAVDDLVAIREIANENGMWMHVDGAFGALLRLSSHRSMVDGIEHADSLAFDFHKWFHIQYDVGMLLIRPPSVHKSTFSIRASYLKSLDFGIARGGMWFSDLGIQLSRSFRSLKVWMHLQLNGIDIFGKLVDQNIEQAKYFTDLLSTDKNWQIMAEVRTNIVCFRYHPKGIDESELNSLNREILRKIYENNDFIISYTTLEGKFCLRMAITNHRTKLADLDLAWNELISIASTMNQ